jgi:hypothetical protein
MTYLQRSNAVKTKDNSAIPNFHEPNKTENARLNSPLSKNTGLTI